MYEGTEGYIPLYKDTLIGHNDITLCYFTRCALLEEGLKVSDIIDKAPRLLSVKALGCSTMGAVMVDLRPLAPMDTGLSEDIQPLKYGAL